MSRIILRTSRWLAQRRINNLIPIALRHLPPLESVQTCVFPRLQYATSSNKLDVVDSIAFESICNETLHSLTDYFEAVVDDTPSLKGADVTFSDGVLTVNFGANGTYVINRQTPNKQIWLSSPSSGPKRYDLVLQNGGYWIYRHDGVTLHQLLQQEISKIVFNVDFSKCAHSFIPMKVV